MLTVVLTAHKEGMILYRVLRAWQRTRSFAHQAGLPTRLIVALDQADHTTRRIVVNHQLDLWIDQIIVTNHGDPGLARNTAIAAVLTPYVAIGDGDDLPSENWLVEGLARLKKSGSAKAAIHPELMVHFDQKRYWYRQVDQTDPTCDLRQLIYHHYWSSAIITSTKLLRDNPYLPAAIGSGFGHEDWEWNSRLITRGGTHYIAKNTIRFYRHKQKDSVCKGHDQYGELTLPNEFTDNEYFLGLKKSFRSTSYILPPKRVQRVWRKIKRRQLEDLPVWAKKESYAMCLIEPDISPVEPVWNRYDLRAPSPWPGEMYARLLKLWPAEKAITHLFILPWIGIGGADKMARRYIEEVANTPGNNVAVLITQKALTWRKNEMNKSILWLEFTSHESALFMDWQVAVVCRLLLQRQPRVVQVINSRLGWELIKRHGRTLAQTSTWYANLFCDDISLNGEPEGYAQDYLTSCAPYLTQIFTDSTVYRQELLTRFGVEKNKIIVHHAPAEVIRTPKISSSSTLLWAGRLDRQKRPDVLFAIAKNLPDVNFAVYGRAVLEQDSIWVEKLRRLKNVRLHGQYRSFVDLPHDRFAAFLYTSQWDGLPNVLLEAAASGLPIIAPNVGGVSELVTQPTGYLVDRCDDIDQYRSAILHLLSHREYAHEKARRAQALVAERHSQAVWAKQLRAVKGYLTDSADSQPAMAVQK